MASSRRSIRFQRALMHSKAGEGFSLDRWFGCVARVALFGVLDVGCTPGSKA